MRPLSQPAAGTCRECHELSCFVMRPAGNVMFRHGPPRLLSASSGQTPSSPRPPSRGPASVLAAASTVRPALCRLRQYRKSWMDPGSEAGVTGEGRDRRPSCPPGGCLAADISPSCGRGDFACPSVFRMAFLHRVPFRSPRRRSGRQAGPCFRAYRVRACARAWARVCAGAVRAPECPRAHPRNQGAPFPSVPVDFFRAGANRDVKRPRADAASSHPNIGTGAGKSS